MIFYNLFLLFKNIFFNFDHIFENLKISFPYFLNLFFII